MPAAIPKEIKSLLLRGLGEGKPLSDEEEFRLLKFRDYRLLENFLNTAEQFSAVFEARNPKGKEHRDNIREPLRHAIERLLKALDEE